ncbi:MAG: RES family NAD+ phosphorylase [Thalassococcus sp.]|uniref:RES family NAD+ phosphorylase n=1 Tax=Thalassococcus sp. TaxID=1928858 RepID=UPI001B093018|nr:RES family NAD+ phosphorylase [Thalassococcus sp.]MBO6868928.1 RES family NAD+ phosphorylase [Thalassococcus sp.]
MSAPTWTPDALRSEAQPYNKSAWRLVEAQHHVSTLKLTDSLAEQELLEDILEDTKPPVPSDCAHLDYLLATPFRYRPYPHGSRFRRAGITPGVWYGAEHPNTALAEMAFYCVLFYAESPGTPFPNTAADYTAFAVPVKTATAVDLTSGELAKDAAAWEHLTDYAPCQTLAEAARDIGAEVIRYRSVRDPDGGANVAVLTCTAFARAKPTQRQTWRIRISANGVQALCDHPRTAVEFPPDSFDADSRVAGMDWTRA